VTLYYKGGTPIYNINASIYPLGTKRGMLLHSNINAQIVGSNLFQNKKKLMVAFFIEILVLSLFSDFISPYIELFLWSNVLYLPSIIIEFLVICYIWFCHAFDYKTYWKPILYPQIVFVVNYLIVHSYIL